MTRFVARVAFAFALLSPLNVALRAAEVNEAFAHLSDTFEMIRTVIQSERKAVVAENMQLTEDEAQAFWPVYDAYRAEVSKLGDRQLKIITDYAANFEDLSDELAENMLNEHLAIQADLVSLRKHYVSKFSEVLPPKKVTRFYQLENKLDAVTNVDMARKIPLVN